MAFASAAHGPVGGNSKAVYRNKRVAHQLSGKGIRLIWQGLRVVYRFVGPGER